MSVALAVNNQGTTTVQFERDGATTISEVVGFFSELAIDVINVTICSRLYEKNRVLLNARPHTVLVRVNATENIVEQLLAMGTRMAGVSMTIHKPSRGSKTNPRRLRLITNQ